MSEPETTPSVGMRAKKFMGSKTAGTKLGRKAILKVLGEDGTNLFNSLKESAKLFYGKAEGKKLKQDMVKMVLKINLLVTEKQLTPENTASGEEPIHALLFQASRDLDGSSENIDPKPLATRLQAVSTVWTEIVRSKMKESNLQRLQLVLKMLGDEQFLHNVFNNNEYQEHRESIAMSLTRLMQSFGLNDPLQVGNCQVSSCLNQVVRSRGLFRSAGFCAFHHAEYFQFLLSKPTLQEFLLEERAANSFIEFLSARAQIAPCQFLKSVADFKSISSQKMRLRSVNSIKRKFLSENVAPKLDLAAPDLQDLLEEIDGIDEDDPRISTGLFRHVEEKIRSDLETLFSEQFVKSEYFERFVASYQLSSADLKLAQKQGASVSDA